MSKYKGTELTYYSALKFSLEDDGMVDQKEYRFLNELKAQMGISAEVHSQMEMEIRENMGETEQQGTQSISDSVISKSTIIGTKVEISQNALGSIENHYDRMIDALQNGNMIAAKSAYGDAKLIDVDEAKAYFQEHGKEIAKGYSLIANSYALKLSEVNYYEEQDYEFPSIWNSDVSAEAEIESIRNDLYLAQGNAEAFYSEEYELYESILAGVNHMLNNPEWAYFQRVGIGGKNANGDSKYRQLYIDSAKKTSSFFYGMCRNLINSSEDYDKDQMNEIIDGWVNEFVSIYPPCNVCKGTGKETKACQNCGGDGKAGIFGSACSDCNGSGRIKTGEQACNSCKGWKIECSEVESEIIPYPT